ncbi:MAG: polysaccharide deacetylase family protein, partial [Actinomycetota bacterium]|nr:polysaccharide deacetylase family protein [Actinomycetota bacterium]
MTLVYHGVNRVDPAEDPARLVVSPDHLLAHLRWLQNRGYGFETASAMAARGQPSPRTAIVTFDDGWSDAVDTAPMLHGLGIPATFYVCPGWWGGHHP